MIRLDRLFTLLLALGLSACAVTPRPPTLAAAPRAPVTILISIDAFRPDYMGRGDTPNLDALAKGGLQATMRPSFPALTFPNHYTLVTGLRPDRNGIVANIFHDPANPDVRFYNKEAASSASFWWAQAEPIWITAEKAGIKTGTMFWPGEEAAHDGVRASDWARFDPDYTSAQRMRTVLDWMRRPAEIRPAFVTLYIDEVDKAGHKFGPIAPGTAAAVRAVDGLIGELKAGLDALDQPANLVIVSDHGMREIKPETVVLLDTIIAPQTYRLTSYGPFASIDPLPGQEEAVARAFLKPDPRMQCWRKGEVPARYHYGANPRVAAIVCLAAPGSEVVTTLPTNKGDHGYDIDDPEMAALFLVNGPAFRRGAAIPKTFDNVDLYPLLARLIGVPALPSDGSDATLAPLLSGERR